MSTFQPPVVIDPNQSSSDQISFINQNFQNLASVLEANGFRIVQEGVLAIPTPSPTSLSVGAGKFGTANNVTQIAHGLNFVPVVLGAFGASGGGLLPFTTYGPVGSSGGTIFWNTIQISSDATYIYISNTFVGFGGTAGITFANTAGSLSGNVQYYLLQQTAS